LIIPLPQVLMQQGDGLNDSQELRKVPAHAHRIGRYPIGQSMGEGDDYLPFSSQLQPSLQSHPLAQVWGSQGLVDPIGLGMEDQPGLFR
jgi:hypothetical protein